MDCISHFKPIANLFSGQYSNEGQIKLTESHQNANGPIDILALGSGWTWSFLGPAAGEKGLKAIATSRKGGNETIPFDFDPESDDTTPFQSLPDAKTIVIIFPLYSADAAKRLVHGYTSTRSKPFMRKSSSYIMSSISEKESSFDSGTDAIPIRFILLGSVGIWGNGGPTLQYAPLSAQTSIQTFKKESHKPHHKPKKPDLQSPWFDRKSKIDDVPRARAENALLEFNSDKDSIQSSVLCLAGLFGHGRSPRRYVSRIAPTKEQLAQLGSVHLIHGHDVARAILAMHQQWEKAAGQRWLLTNERVYDLWDLISQWGNAGEDGRDHFPQGSQPLWVQELVNESKKKKDVSQRIRGLPRTPDQLGYALDSSDFWSTFELYPEVPWVD